MQSLRQEPLASSTRQALESALTDRKQALQEHLRSLLAEVESDRGGMDVHDTKDTSFLAALAEIRVAGGAREIQELRDIDAALARMHLGVYGVCSDCGDDIPEERLRAFPTAKRCRPCQEEKEKE